MVRSRRRERRFRWLRWPLAFVSVLLVAELALRATFAVQGWVDRPEGSAFEIWCIGGSTAAGEPYQTLSVPRLTSLMFEGRLQGRSIVVRNLAQPGESLYPQVVRLRRALAGRSSEPGALLVLAGHNEADLRSRPHDEPPDFVEQTHDWLSTGSFLGSELLYLARRYVLHDFGRSLAFYEFQLREAVRLARDAGLRPVLGIPAANIAEVEPNCYGYGGAPLDEAAVMALLEPVDRAVASGDCQEAQRHATESVSARHCGALAWFVVGQCWRDEGDLERAAAAFRRAVDEDERTLFGRMTTPQANLVRRLGAELDVPVLDVPEIFRRAQGDGLFDHRLFVDGQHPNLDGYALMGRAFAAILAEHTGASVNKPFVSGATAAEATGLNVVQEAEAHVYSASWLLTVSVGHPRPDARLRLAARNYEAARALSPERLDPVLGLALVQLARRSDFLRRAHTVSLLEAWPFYFTRSHCVPRTALPKLIAEMRAAAVEPELLNTLQRRAVASYSGACAEWAAR